MVVRVRATQGLILFVIPAIRVAIAERCEIERAVTVPDDVVARRAVVAH